MMNKTWLVALASGLTACSGSPGSSNYVLVQNQGPVVTVPIDDGAIVVEENGVGLFVEHSGCGEWHVFATCDTATSGYPCFWDSVVLAPEDSTLEVTEEEDLDDGEDFVVRVDPAAVRLFYETTEGQDGVWLSAPPGVPLLLDSLLDGSTEPFYPSLSFPYQWIGDETIHLDGPSNRLEFEPPADLEETCAIE